MTDKIICEKCGCEMTDRSSGDSICVECPQCGWGWATTTYDPSLDDNTAYELWLLPGNAQRKPANHCKNQSYKLLTGKKTVGLFYPCKTVSI